MRTLPDIIKSISNTLQFFIDRDKLSEKSRKQWEYSIQQLVDFNNRNETYIESLQRDNEHLRREINRQGIHILKLEAICLIHGIENINMYLARPLGMLEQEAVSAIKEGWMQLPLPLNYRNITSNIQSLLQ